MKTLVTGGAGFIGSNVVKHLLKKNEAIKVLHLPNEHLNNLSGLDVEMVSGNILNVNDIDRAMKGCNKVYHLAAIYALWMPNPKIMFDVNIEGSRNVFDACLKHNIEKIVHTSSLVRFAGQGHNNICDENSPFKFGESGDKYSISKFKAHQLAEQYANEKGLNVTIVCPALPIGPGDIGPTPTGRYLQYSTTAPLITYTNTIINVGDVRDIAYGHVLAMKKGEKGRSYILGGMENITMKDLFEKSLKVSNRDIPLIEIPKSLMRITALGMQLNTIFFSRKPPLLTYEAVKANEMGLATNCDRAIKELQYNCRPIDESIKDAITWFNNTRTSY